MAQLYGKLSRGRGAELPGCHTQAKTLEELMRRVEEAIRLYLETVGVPRV